MVSPHYDDAPLSLGQSMFDGSLSHHDVTVGIVFGRSSWTRWFHPTRRRAPIATAIRRAEEQRNAHRFGYRVRVASCEEAILRLDTADATVFLDPGFDARASPEREVVSRVLGGWAGSYDGLVLPLGVGDHIDHKITAAAATGLGVPVAHYEDRPYACALDDDQLAEVAAALEPGLRPVHVSGPITDAKVRRVWYPSQFDPSYLDAMAADIGGQRRERIWIRDDDHPLASG